MLFVVVVVVIVTAVILEGCRRRFTCPQSRSASASSMASNISIVASPSNTNDSSDQYRIDLHIQWEDSNESDGMYIGMHVIQHTPHMTIT